MLGSLKRQVLWIAIEHYFYQTMYTALMLAMKDTRFDILLQHEIGRWPPPRVRQLVHGLNFAGGL